MRYFEEQIDKLKYRLKRKGFEELQITIDISFWKPIGDHQVRDLSFLRERFEKEYSVTKKRIAQKSDKMCFDSCTAIINGVKVHYFGKHYDNPDFDKEACIKRCAEGRERWRILEEHKDEMDVEGRIQRIKEKKEIGCHG